MLYLGCEDTNSCFQINSLRWRYKQLLSKGIPTFIGGINSYFLKASLR